MKKNNFEINDFGVRAEYFSTACGAAGLIVDQYAAIVGYSGCGCIDWCGEDDVCGHPEECPLRHVCAFDHVNGWDEVMSTFEHWGESFDWYGDDDEIPE